MYLNVVKLITGKTLRFKTKNPCMCSNILEDLNSFTDTTTGRIVTFTGHDVVSIESYKQKDKNKYITV